MKMLLLGRIIWSKWWGCCSAEDDISESGNCNALKMEAMLDRKISGLNPCSLYLDNELPRTEIYIIPKPSSISSLAPLYIVKLFRFAWDKLVARNVETLCRFRKHNKCPLLKFPLQAGSLTIASDIKRILWEVTISRQQRSNEGSSSRDRGSHFRLLPAAPLHYPIVPPFARSCSLAALSPLPLKPL